MDILNKDNAPLFHSPWQVLLGCLVGGPLAAAYFIQANDRAAGKTMRANLAVLIGALLAAAEVALFIFWLGPVARIALWVAYAYIAQSLTTFPEDVRPMQTNLKTGLVVAAMLVAYGALFAAELSAFARAMPASPVINVPVSEPARPSLPVE